MPLMPVAEVLSNFSYSSLFSNKLVAILGRRLDILDQVLLVRLKSAPPQGSAKIAKHA